MKSAINYWPDISQSSMWWIQPNRFRDPIPGLCYSHDGISVTVLALVSHTHTANCWYEHMKMRARMSIMHICYGWSSITCNETHRSRPGWIPYVTFLTVRCFICLWSLISAEFSYNYTRGFVAFIHHVVYVYIPISQRLLLTFLQIWMHYVRVCVPKCIFLCWYVKFLFRCSVSMHRWCRDNEMQGFRVRSAEGIIYRVLFSVTSKAGHAYPFRKQLLSVISVIRSSS